MPVRPRKPKPHGRGRRKPTKAENVLRRVARDARIKEHQFDWVWDPRRDMREENEWIEAVNALGHPPVSAKELADAARIHLKLAEHIFARVYGLKRPGP